MTVQSALPPAQSGNDVHAHAPLRLARKLRLNQLLIVESVLQTRSFATTAQHLGMTQSAITKSVHELEAFFDAKLFERTNRGVRPTELGLAMQEHVRVILAEVRYMTDSLNALRLGEAGHIVIGTLTSATSRLLPDAIHALRARHPDISVTIRVGDRSQLHDYLVDGKIDIVIGTVPPSKENQQLAYYPLYEDDLCIVAGGKHPLLAKGRSLVLEELLPYPWIVPSHESLARAKIDRMFLDAGLALPANAVESLSPITNIGLLMDQQSLTFMSGGLVELFLATGALARLDVGQRCEFGQVGYAIRSNRPTNLATQTFIACLKDEVAGFNQTLAALLDGAPPAAHG
jgi:DNA-binding transcriptional LysR family regulator